MIHHHYLLSLFQMSSVKKRSRDHTSDGKKLKKVKTSTKKDKIVIGAHVKCRLNSVPKKGQESKSKLHYGIIQSLEPRHATVKFYRSDRRGRRFDLKVKLSALQFDENINKIKYGGLLEEADDEFLTEIKMRKKIDWGLPPSLDTVSANKAQEIIVDFMTQMITEHMKPYLLKTYFSQDGNTQFSPINPLHMQQALRLDTVWSTFLGEYNKATPVVLNFLRLPSVRKSVDDLLDEYVQYFLTK